MTPFSIFAAPAQGVCLEAVRTSREAPSDGHYVPSTSDGELALPRDEAFGSRQNADRERDIFRTRRLHYAMWLYLALLNGPVAVERFLIRITVRREDLLRKQRAKDWALLSILVCLLLSQKGVRGALYA